MITILLKKRDHVECRSFEPLLEFNGDMGFLCGIPLTHRTLYFYIVANIDISTWLRYYELEKYETYFRKLKIEILGDLKRVKMSDELMDDLEVMVPGHRKRLLKAGKLDQEFIDEFITRLR